MDPVTMIVVALAAGAAAGLKPTAEQAIKDAYAGVKALIQRRYSEVDLTPLERKPESDAKRKSLREDLADAEADKDQELMKSIRSLLEALTTQPPPSAAACGIDLKDVRAAYLKVQEVISEGDAIRMQDTEIPNGIDIGRVQAGNVKDSRNP